MDDKLTLHCTVHLRWMWQSRNIGFEHRKKLATVTGSSSKKCQVGSPSSPAAFQAGCTRWWPRLTQIAEHDYQLYIFWLTTWGVNTFWEVSIISPFGRSVSFNRTTIVWSCMNATKQRNGAVSNVSRLNTVVTHGFVHWCQEKSIIPLANQALE